MRFDKYQGLGNDFVLVDRLRTDVVLTPGLVRQLCDRRLGVGADGVLEIRASQTAVAEMVVHNADGSLAEMCGNGLRCVARYLASRDPGLPPRYLIATGAGPLSVHHRDAAVAVDMGAVHDQGMVEISLQNEVIRGHAVSLGNPHYVLYGRWRRADAERLGPLLERHSRFPEGVNVSFATVRDEAVELFVWERACGLTLACGTGACATAAVGWLDGHLKDRSQVSINLPGGRLMISGGPNALTMLGPAEAVFEGEWTTP